MRASIKHPAIQPQAPRMLMLRGRRRMRATVMRAMRAGREGASGCMDMLPSCCG